MLGIHAGTELRVPSTKPETASQVRDDREAVSRLGEEPDDSCAQRADWYLLQRTDREIGMKRLIVCAFASALALAACAEASGSPVRVAVETTTTPTTTAL